MSPDARLSMVFARRCCKGTAGCDAHRASVEVSAKALVDSDRLRRLRWIQLT
jgi:hypothetical protein